MPVKLPTQFEYNTALIRKLLTETFSDEEFSIFCYDYFPDVYLRFSTITFPAKVQLLIDYCKRTNAFAQLLQLVSDFNPTKYAEFSEAFHHFVPVNPTPPALSEAIISEPPAPPQLATPAQILVVEDDPTWQAILQDSLVEAGYLVELAPTFDEARRKLQTRQFDLITLDARLQSHLETHEGLLLLDYIRNRPDNFTLPIIVVSGQIDRRDLIRAFKKFAVNNVLLKESFDYGEFSEAVRDALEAKAKKLQG